MSLRADTRNTEGRFHRCGVVVESLRKADDRVLQRQVLYLGKITDTQKAAWARAIEVLASNGEASQVAMSPPALDCEVVQIRLNVLSSSHRPSQWGACWLALEPLGQLNLDGFGPPRLQPWRQRTRWLNVLKTLTSHCLIDPGSEWRLHRH